MEILNSIAKSLMDGDDKKIVEEVRQAIDAGIPTAKILDDGLIAGMNVVGKRFKNHEMFLPEVLLSARAMTAGVALLKPLLIAEEVPSRGKVILGSVQGDLHDIGKNMVIIMLRGVGFDIVDLGINVSADDFVRKVAEEKPHILGLSALLTTTMPQMKKVIEGLAKAGLREKVKVMVGGAPVSPTFARQIGADGYAADAGEAVEVAKRLVAGF